MESISVSHVAHFSTVGVAQFCIVGNTNSAQEQTQVSQGINTTIQEINSISLKTTQSTAQTTQTIDSLVLLAEGLHDVVARFKTTA